MRINAYNAISQIYQSNKPSGTKSTSKSAAATDRVQISSIGREYQVAKQSVAQSSDIREDQVALMKQKYQGKVDVDVDRFADVLLAKYQGL
ncbi:anti-sigma-28 factor, FlgM family [Lachnospiraceae bacterium C10]|jgi:negative regulator of flagellin synthesis FlgM|nr:flagellar biosynthesis anti-sigma factor FlgM [Lachnospiraceae bacterium]SCW34922.1 anti-sigma-28 factor, FlgM family [Lachnospiraceae bacterium C10]SDW21247.1 anti-sigma-28 factor, FlgM family [Lachnospiraceae bacterium KHCPX20]